MKKILLTALSLAGITGFSMAQDQDATTQEKVALRTVNTVTPEERAKAITEKIHALVKLTPEQYKKVLEMNKTSVEERISATASSTTTGSADNAAGLVAARPATDILAKLKDILTPEQMKKLEASKTSENAVMQQRIGTAAPLQQAAPEK